MDGLIEVEQFNDTDSTPDSAYQPPSLVDAASAAATLHPEQIQIEEEDRNEVNRRLYYVFLAFSGGGKGKT